VPIVGHTSAKRSDVNWSWEQIALLCSTRFGLRSETQQCVRALVNRGVRDLVLDGLTDVALARNCGLSAAAELTRTHRDIALWLMVDDDMMWTLEAAEQIVDAAMASGRPTSAVYVTDQGAPAVTTEPGWAVCTGLGFFALPSARLLQLYDESPERLGVGGRNPFRVFVQCGIYPSEAAPWHSEDYWLCERLGNVDVQPVAVTHIKTARLSPDQTTVQDVAARVVAFSAQGARGLQKV